MVILQRAKPNDAIKLAAFEAQSFTMDAITLSRYRYLLTKAKAEVWMAQERGEVLAAVVILFRPHNHLARIYSIAVAENAQRQGWGSRLLDKAIKRAKALGCTRLCAEIHPENLASQALFSQHGWEVFGRYEDFYEDGAAAIRVRRFLP